MGSPDPARIQKVQVNLEWHPSETLPRDRPIVICIRRADRKTGEIKTQLSRAQWGRMKAYPNTESSWLPLEGDPDYHDNSSWGNEEEFRAVTYGEIYTDEQIAQHNTAYYSYPSDAHKRIGRDTVWSYRGWTVTHWTELYEISVAPPSDSDTRRMAETCTGSGPQDRVARADRHRPSSPSSIPSLRKMETRGG
jgi:hypothetical protein